MTSETVPKTSSPPETIGDFIREKRIAAYLTLQQLADRMKANQPYLSLVETGQRPLAAKYVARLRQALSLSARDMTRVGELMELDRRERFLRDARRQPRRNRTAR